MGTRRAQPTTETMNVSTVRQQWSALLTAVFKRQRRIIIEKSGIPVAALISIADLQRLDRYDADRAADFAVLEEIGAAFKDVPPDELEREVAKALAEAREEMRAENAVLDEWRETRQSVQVS